MPTEKQYEAMTTELNGRGDSFVYFGQVFVPGAWLDVTPPQAEWLKALGEFTVREKAATS